MSQQNIERGVEDSPLQSSASGTEFQQVGSPEGADGMSFKGKILPSDYHARGLDICHFCGLKYNVGSRIPRILVGCGHTFCTNCLCYFLRNSKIRCPLCRKMLKGVESVDRLPLNFNILYETVT